MEGLLDDLVGDMRPVKVAGINMIHTRFNRFPQDRYALVHIARWSPDARAGKLHRAIAHAVHLHRCTRERKTAAKIRLCRHPVAPLLFSAWKFGCQLLVVERDWMRPSASAIEASMLAVRSATSPWIFTVVPFNDPIARAFRL